MHRAVIIVYLLQLRISRKSTDRRQLRVLGDCCHSTALVWLRWVLSWTWQDTDTRRCVCSILLQYRHGSDGTSTFSGADWDNTRSGCTICDVIRSIAAIALLEFPLFRFSLCFEREATLERGLNGLSNATQTKTCRSHMKTVSGKLFSPARFQGLPRHMVEHESNRSWPASTVLPTRRGKIMKIFWASMQLLS